GSSHSEISVRSLHDALPICDNLSFLDCPEILVSQERDNISALIQVIDGAAEDYSLNDLKMCALAAIDNAPVKLIPTSEKVRNREDRKSTRLHSSHVKSSYAV